MNLEEEINSKIGEVRSESLDLSFGEVVNMSKAKELIIAPEYQRLFRWSPEQKSRLVESVLLELPIPPIFVIENSDGVFELIDGLQRISTILQFIEPEVLGLEPLVLEGCDIIEGLNKLAYGQLPLSLRLSLKRSSVRTIVIKKQSKSFLRYEMFKRLNTGGALLAPQEIRNCSFRMLGDEGVNFYTSLMELASLPSFKATIALLPAEELEKKTNEELVLRFFAAKNNRDMFRGSVRDWLDDYMEAILLKKIPFDFAQERHVFTEVFDQIQAKLGETAFVKFRDGKPSGSVAPAYFEAVSIGCFMALPELKAKSADHVRLAITTLVQSEAFREVTGPGANSKTKLERRVQLATEAVKAA